MGLLKDNSIIHAAESADLTAFTYTQIYAGANATPTINGTAVLMSAGVVLDVRIKQINILSGDTGNVFVIGSPINTLKADPNL